MVKKILATIFAIITVFTFSVNCFADDIAGQMVPEYTVKVISSIDNTTGTQYVYDAYVEIYSTASGEKIVYGSLKTDGNGEAVFSLPEGTYFAEEESFILDNKEYSSEPLQFTVSSENDGVILYLKHTARDIPIDTPEEPTTKNDVPFTGSDIAIAGFCGAAIVAAIVAAVVAIVVTRKKKKDQGLISKDMSL